ncbi:MAG: hypothetical protein MJH09_08055 [Cetobacterium sp.]|nr:hypothetical protein [Cetobacterium sp.]
MRYWEKDRPGNFLNSNRRCLREVEEIAIFYKKQCFYNPQKILGKCNYGVGKTKNKIQSSNNNYGTFKQSEVITEEKYPK